MPPLKPCGRIKRPPSPLGLPRSVRPAVLLAPTQPLHQAHRPHPWEVGDVHTTSTSLPAMFWERGKTATLSYLWAWTGKIKMSPVPQREKETNLAPTGVCAPGSSLALVPCSLHIPGPPTISLGGCRAGGMLEVRAAWRGDSKDPRAGLRALTPPRKQGACKGKRETMAEEGSPCAARASSSCVLQGTAGHLGGLWCEYAAILCNAACNTRCEFPPPQAARAGAIKPESHWAELAIFCSAKLPLISVPLSPTSPLKNNLLWFKL